MVVVVWLGGGGVSSCATLNLVAFNNQLYSQKILITDIIKSIQIFFISYKLKYKLQKIIELHNYLHLNFKIV